MTRPLAESVAIVTGAGRGLGRAYARALAAAGARVVVNDAGCGLGGDGLDPVVAEAVAVEIRAAGGAAVASAAPVGSDAAAAGLVELALDRFGRLDVLVNNAGITRSHPVADFPAADWERVLAVHLTGTFLCARHAFGALRRGGRGGRIVNVTSGAGLDAAYPGTAAYAAAKGGIVALTRVIAAEGRPHGITCNAIAPLARTRMSERFLADAGEDVGTADAAALVVYLASAASAAVTGEIFRCRHGRIAVTRPATGAGVASARNGWTADEVAARIAEIVGPP